MFPGLDMYYAGRPQALTVAGEELQDDLQIDHELCEVCIVGTLRHDDIPNFRK